VGAKFEWRLISTLEPISKILEEIATKRHEKTQKEKQLI
jgi:hypothetical protein